MCRRSLGHVGEKYPTDPCDRGHTMNGLDNAAQYYPSLTRLSMRLPGDPFRSVDPDLATTRSRIRNTS